MADAIYKSNGNTLSSTANWKRKYRILIYQHNYPVVTFPMANTSAASVYSQTFTQENPSDAILDVSDLKVVFSIQRTAMYNPNKATITIYNLNASTEMSIVQEGYRIIVEAGYESNYGQIFDGTILMCNRAKQNGTDYILSILALDGTQFLNEGYCSLTYAKGQTARAIVDGITNKAAVGIALGYASPVLGTVKYSKGMVVHGLAKNTLSDIAKSINGTWFVDNGKLYIIAYSDSAAKLPMGLQAIELSEKTGLIGNPAQVQQGVNARMLLNPKVAPYSLVHIKNELITEQLVDIGTFSKGITTPWLLDTEALYRVVSVTFTGDTRGNDWYADITTVTQVGNIPELLSTSSGTAN